MDDGKRNPAAGAGLTSYFTIAETAKEDKPLNTQDFSTDVRKNIGLVRPITEQLDFERIPAELRTLEQWVCWRREERDGKTT